MAKRNPMNKRYQKNTQIGSTRKSAAAAKPKRSGGSPASTKKSSAPRRSSAARGRGVGLPPELRKLQKVSFSLLGGAVVLSVLYLWKGQQAGVFGSMMLGVAYAMMFGALFIDFGKIRPAMKARQAGGAKSAESGKGSKAGKADKPAKVTDSTVEEDSAGSEAK